VWVCKTTLGRIMFNDLLPGDYPFVNDQMAKGKQSVVINDMAERYPMILVAQTVDRLKDAGFYWATRSGVTVAMSDVQVPPVKQEILDAYEKRADKVEKQYLRGALSKDEHNAALVKIWSEATEKVGQAMEDNYPKPTRFRSLCARVRPVT